MSKATPGPWKLVWHGTELYPFPLSVLADDGKSWIARDGTTSSEANARLIAAAPEMLEALKGIFKLIDEGKIGRDTSRDHDPLWVLGAMDVVVGLKLAKDAIAKAEGRDE